MGKKKVSMPAWAFLLAVVGLVTLVNYLGAEREKKAERQDDATYEYDNGAGKPTTFNYPDTKSEDKEPDIHGQRADDGSGKGVRGEALDDTGAVSGTEVESTTATLGSDGRTGDTGQEPVIRDIH